MVDKAMDFVKDVFKDKVDKAGKPYIDHLVRVFRAVDAQGGDQEQRTIALLHDVLEDTDTTVDDLYELFTPRVVRGVMAMTHRPEESYDTYINRVWQNEDATLVKVEDLRDNMDITRLPYFGPKDMNRLMKYHKAYIFLITN